MFIKYNRVDFKYGTQTILPLNFVILIFRTWEYWEFRICIKTKVTIRVEYDQFTI